MFTLIHSWYNLDWAQFSWLHIINDLVFSQAFKIRYETLSHSQYNDEIIRHLFFMFSCKQTINKKYMSVVVCQVMQYLRRKRVWWKLLRRFTKKTCKKLNVFNAIFTFTMIVRSHEVIFTLMRLLFYQMLLHQKILIIWQETFFLRCSSSLRVLYPFLYFWVTALNFDFHRCWTIHHNVCMSKLAT